MPKQIIHPCSLVDNPPLSRSGGFIYRKKRKGRVCNGLYTFSSNYYFLVFGFSCAAGSTTLPWKSSIPVWRSRKKKRKGWSTMNCSIRLLIALRPLLMSIAVAAAAMVPSSLTSIIAFWITLEECVFGLTSSI